MEQCPGDRRGLCAGLGPGAAGATAVIDLRALITAMRVAIGVLVVWMVVKMLAFILLAWDLVQL